MEEAPASEEEAHEPAGTEADIWDPTESALMETAGVGLAGVTVRTLLEKDKHNPVVDVHEISSPGIVSPSEARDFTNEIGMVKETGVSPETDDLSVLPTVEETPYESEIHESQREGHGINDAGPLMESSAEPTSDEVTRHPVEEIAHGGESLEMETEIKEISESVLPEHTGKYRPCPFETKNLVEAEPIVDEDPLAGEHAESLIQEAPTDEILTAVAEPGEEHAPPDSLETSQPVERDVDEMPHEPAPEFHSFPEHEQKEAGTKSFDIPESEPQPAEEPEESDTVDNERDDPVPEVDSIARHEEPEEEGHTPDIPDSESQSKEEPGEPDVVEKDPREKEPELPAIEEPEDTEAATHPVDPPEIAAKLTGDPHEAEVVADEPVPDVLASPEPEELEHNQTLGGLPVEATDEHDLHDETQHEPTLEVTAIATQDEPDDHDAFDSSHESTQPNDELKELDTVEKASEEPMPDGSVIAKYDEMEEIKPALHASDATTPSTEESDMVNQTPEESMSELPNIAKHEDTEESIPVLHAAEEITDPTEQTDSAKHTLLEGIPVLPAAAKDEETEKTHPLDSPDRAVEPIEEQEEPLHENPEDGVPEALPIAKPEDPEDGQTREVQPTVDDPQVPYFVEETLDGPLPEVQETKEHEALKASTVVDEPSQKSDIVDETPNAATTDDTATAEWEPLAEQTTIEEVLAEEPPTEDPQESNPIDEPLMTELAPIVEREKVEDTHTLDAEHDACPPTEELDFKPRDKFILEAPAIVDDEKSEDDHVQPPADEPSEDSKEPEQLGIPLTVCVVETIDHPLDDGPSPSASREKPTEDVEDIESSDLPPDPSNRDSFDTNIEPVSEHAEAVQERNVDELKESVSESVPKDASVIDHTHTAQLEIPVADANSPPVAEPPEEHPTNDIEEKKEQLGRVREPVAEETLIDESQVEVAAENVPEPDAVVGEEIPDKEAEEPTEEDVNQPARKTVEDSAADLFPITGKVAAIAAVAMTAGGAVEHLGVPTDEPPASKPTEPKEAFEDTAVQLVNVPIDDNSETHLPEPVEANEPVDPAVDEPIESHQPDTSEATEKIEDAVAFAQRLDASIDEPVENPHYGPVESWVDKVSERINPQMSESHHPEKVDPTETLEDAGVPADYLEVPIDRTVEPLPPEPTEPMKTIEGAEPVDTAIDEPVEAHYSKRIEGNDITEDEIVEHVDVPIDTTVEDHRVDPVQTSETIEEAVSAPEHLDIPTGETVEASSPELLEPMATTEDGVEEQVDVPELEPQEAVPIDLPIESPETVESKAAAADAVDELAGMPAHESLEVSRAEPHEAEQITQDAVAESGDVEKRDAMPRDEVLEVCPTEPNNPEEIVKDTLPESEQFQSPTDEAVEKSEPSGLKEKTGDGGDHHAVLVDDSVEDSHHECTDAKDAAEDDIADHPSMPPDGAIHLEPTEQGDELDKKTHGALNDEVEEHVEKSKETSVEEDAEVLPNTYRKADRKNEENLDDAPETVIDKVDSHIDPLEQITGDQQLQIHEECIDSAPIFQEPAAHIDPFDAAAVKEPVEDAIHEHDDKCVEVPFTVDASEPTPNDAETVDKRVEDPVESPSTGPPPPTPEHHYVGGVAALAGTALAGTSAVGGLLLVDHYLNHPPRHDLHHLNETQIAERTDESLEEEDVNPVTHLEEPIEEEKQVHEHLERTNEPVIYDPTATYGDEEPIVRHDLDVSEDDHYEKGHEVEGEHERVPGVAFTSQQPDEVTGEFTVHCPPAQEFEDTVDQIPDENLQSGVEERTGEDIDDVQYDQQAPFETLASIAQHPEEIANESNVKAPSLEVPEPVSESPEEPNVETETLQHVEEIPQQTVPAEIEHQSMPQEEPVPQQEGMPKQLVQEGEEIQVEQFVEHKEEYQEIQEDRCTEEPRVEDFEPESSEKAHEIQKDIVDVDDLVPEEEESPLEDVQPGPTPDDTPETHEPVQHSNVESESPPLPVFHSLPLEKQEADNVDQQSQDEPSVLEPVPHDEQHHLSQESVKCDDEIVPGEEDSPVELAVHRQSPEDSAPETAAHDLSVSVVPEMEETPGGIISHQHLLPFVVLSDSIVEDANVETKAREDAPFGKEKSSKVS